MTPWGRALMALRLLRVDPDGLGGILVGARTGPVRDAFLSRLPDARIRLHPAMAQDTLDGGIDISTSLSQGTLVHQRGLLEARGATFLLGMAERVPPLMAARLSAALDAPGGTVLIACDESTGDEAPPPDTLTDRLAFHISLDGLSLADIANQVARDSGTAISAKVAITDTALADIVTLAVTLGITSLRAPTLALNAARAHAALAGRARVAEADILAAAELVLAPRATRMPDTSPEPPAPENKNAAEDPGDGGTDLPIPDEILLAAVATALPAGLLEKSVSKRSKTASGDGSGRKHIGNRRGRPLPARDTGRRHGAARVDLLATLRAAVPWQKLRRAGGPDRAGPIIHPSDLRYKRYEALSDRLLVFAVDASGSAALARLAEAKGAVELLLAEAYARRDHVALISFRGETAETLLPPTRSLVQTKRRLADLPGGGGTPLAAGLNTALETVQQAMRKGLSPLIVLLTDGRANIALDGTPDRNAAAADAQRVAATIARARIDTIVIDTGRRPEPALADLAASLRGRYVSLPRADARSLSRTVSDTLAR